MAKKITDKWELPKNDQKFKRQVTFVARFTDNWQKVSAIVVRLKFTENNILRLKYYYLNPIRVRF